MIALDSSVWIEGWKSSEVVERVDALIIERGGDPLRTVVSAPVLFETYRWLLRYVDDELAVAEHAAMLERHDIVSVDAHLARAAAMTSVTTGLAAADATILAAARSRHATLLTFDVDFAGIPDVVVLDR